MKTRLRLLRLCGILTMLLMVIGRPLPVSAQEPEAASPKANGVDINSQAQANGPPSSPRAPGSVAKITAAMSSVSPAVADILRMHAAGVDPQVIQAYVEHSGKPFNPTAAEIVSLHENGISDALIASLIQKAAQARQAAGPPAPAAAAAAPVQPPPATAYPEYPAYGYSPAYTYPAAAYPDYSYYSYSPVVYFGSYYRGYPYCYRPYFSHYGSYCYPYRSYYPYRSQFYHRSPYFAPGRFSPHFQGSRLTVGVAGRVAPGFAPAFRAGVGSSFHPRMTPSFHGGVHAVRVGARR